jgi:hypothetical protein
MDMYKVKGQYGTTMVDGTLVNGAMVNGPVDNPFVPPK